MSIGLADPDRGDRKTFYTRRSKSVSGKNGVGKAQSQQIHDRFFAEVVIDAIYLVFVKDPADYIINLL